jgi:signal peptidase II
MDRSVPARVAWGRMVATLVVVLAADQIVKAIVKGQVARGERSGLLLGFDLVNVRNTGVAFSQLQDGGAIIGVVVAIVVVGLLVYFSRHATDRLIWLPTGMLVGGALGNALDRITQGAVVDFLKPPHWPAFNLADAAITVGVVLLVLLVGREDAAHRRT